MAKDTFYFSHDYNPRSDEKIKRLLSKHGYLGYGLYWAIIEDLYNNANALPTDYDCMAFDLRATPEQVKSILNDFDLFVVDGDFFSSNSVKRRIEQREQKSAKARESANNRWNKSESYANALPTQSDSNAIKERKGKEIKGNDNTHQIFADRLLLNELELEAVTESKRKLTPELIKQFHANCITSSKKHDHYSEYKRHLANWLRKQPIDQPTRTRKILKDD